MVLSTFSFQLKKRNKSHLWLLLRFLSHLMLADPYRGMPYISCLNRKDMGRYGLP